MEKSGMFITANEKNPDAFRSFAIRRFMGGAEPPQLVTRIFELPSRAFCRNSLSKDMKKTLPLRGTDNHNDSK
jgi:hypothetical protein